MYAAVKKKHLCWTKVMKDLPITDATINPEVARLKERTLKKSGNEDVVNLEAKSPREKKYQERVGKKSSADLMDLLSPDPKEIAGCEGVRPMSFPFGDDFEDAWPSATSPIAKSYALSLEKDSTPSIS